MLRQSHKLLARREAKRKRAKKRSKRNKLRNLMNLSQSRLRKIGRIVERNKLKKGKGSLSKRERKKNLSYSKRLLYINTII